ncbi:MobF family relaxase [Jiangella alkaliphila]|uniref:Conjugative relaxase domain-containing protein, TrwC/TraI family n=1 Tax=Jiangella alkaliphila TaxID=419479 RepID=A0A1H2L7Q9_9ACTN|nr:MobF family relaxase [Jiangella alkaliphila]SDU77097.1 conjugative relaxase domain-containing protein, TrwC/TraI family [Jiangella alkaliphila]
MTVSMRVMSAGDGYKYLAKTIAAADGDRSLSTPLTRYYVEKGTPPGWWLGSGLASLGGPLRVGDRVSEPQLQLLIGMGRNPLTGQLLGRAHPALRCVADRIHDRVDDLNPALTGEEQGLAVTAIEDEETKRGTRRVVAGFDFTFSIPKSASVVWAVADAGTQGLIAQAHHAAIADVVAFMEREVAATRMGATPGDGAVAQVDVTGVIATAFDHFDSRAGDPHLHTHVVISNKVRTVLDEQWRALDGRPMHAATVALSELHEALFADRLTRVLGVAWEARERGRDRNPEWAISTVPAELVAEFSTRSRHIDAETDRLIDAYVAEHGRRPSRRTILRLRAQATLATRPAKEVHSLAELTAGWRTRASGMLRADATGWARSVTAAGGAPPPLLRADDVPLDLIGERGLRVLEVVGEKRSTWRRWNLYAEAARQTMGWRFATTADREAVIGLVVDAAERGSLRLTPPELAPSPAAFQRADGTSVFRPKHSTVFSSHQLLAAEDRLLARSRTATGPTLELATIEVATRRRGRARQRLDAHQAAALTAIAMSGRVVDVLVGPAGTGKTTAMHALRRGWEREHGYGSVVGLAPSEAAADVLAGELGIPTENTAKWWHDHRTRGSTFTAGQLVIVDEASLAGTLSLDRITAAAHRAGAKVLLVGDYAQLQSVDAGGAFSLLVHDRDDAPELFDVYRFTQRWERTASLQLRHANPDVIDTYLEHDRVLDGDTDAMVDAAYTAWRADTRAGKASVLITEARHSVTELNLRARTDLILDGTVTPATGEVALHDGASAAAGDTIITRRNERRLRTRNGWVRNGDRWTVLNVQPDGSITVRRAGRRRGQVLLPAGYVAEHVDLGYAITAHRAQGITTDTAHVLVLVTTTLENLYVALTRGRNLNMAYVATDQPDPNHTGPHPTDNPDATARSVLYGVLHHRGAELSAHETITAEHDQWGSIAQLAAEYDTIAAAAQHDRWVTLIRASGLSPDEVDEAVTSDAFGALTAELRRAEANHHRVDALLPQLVRAHGFHDADDIAAVLHKRLAHATTRPAPARVRDRRAPRHIAGLIPEATGPMSPDMRDALTQRRTLLEARAAATLDTALHDHQPWTTHLGRLPADTRHAALWRHHARTVAAYRDRYRITAPAPLGPEPQHTAQKIDAARAATALAAAQRLSIPTRHSAADAVTQGAGRPQL